MTKLSDDPPGDNAAKYGFLALLRRVERQSGNKPRIGKNLRLKDEAIRLGQDPYLAFPDDDFSQLDLAAKPPRARLHMLGLFGPHGALPLNTTEEVYRWFRKGRPSFVRFTDILVARFQQLFFRAWSDARPITQFDKPDQDRFRRFVGALGGVGTEAFEQQDRIDDIVKTPLIGLFGPRVKSPIRLRQMLEAHLDAAIEIEEHAPSWMSFEPENCNRLGAVGSTLGQDMHLGSRLQSVGEKIRLDIKVQDLAAYRRFLPGGADHGQLQDIVFWYLGQSFDVDVSLSLPRGHIAPAALGKTAEIGWMACIAPVKGNDSEMVEITRYTLNSEAA